MSNLDNRADPAPRRCPHFRPRRGLASQNVYAVAEPIVFILAGLEGFAEQQLTANPFFATVVGENEAEVQPQLRFFLARLSAIAVRRGESATLVRYASFLKRPEPPSPRIVGSVKAWQRPEWLSIPACSRLLRALAAQKERDRARGRRQNH